MGFNVTSNQRRIKQLSPQIKFNVNSIQIQIQPLNIQIGFNVNSIQRQIQPLNQKWNSMSNPYKGRFNH